MTGFYKKIIIFIALLFLISFFYKPNHENNVSENNKLKTNSSQQYVLSGIDLIPQIKFNLTEKTTMRMFYDGNVMIIYSVKF